MVPITLNPILSLEIEVDPIDIGSEVLSRDRTVLVQQRVDLAIACEVDGSCVEQNWQQESCWEDFYYGPEKRGQALTASPTGNIH